MDDPNAMSYRIASREAYARSIEFLYSLRLFGLKLGLENTSKLAALAGNPQDRLRFIHIAGTNGKGSVAAMLESIYRSAGLKVGLYTSPHLISFRERIQVNRQRISEKDVVRLVAEFRCFSKSVEPPVNATFFEFVTVMALHYFAEQQCDLVIWETGLGGRLDATNIVTPLLSIVTNVEQDHQRWLGHELKSIAAEKAGIIKPHVPVVTAASEPEALAVIEQTAIAQDSPLTIVTPAHISHPPLDRLQLPLMGWHQRLNAATALAAVQALEGQLPVGEQSICDGLQRVRWPGRLQVIQRGHGQSGEQQQLVLLDGAHNASGATSLRAVLEEEYANSRPALILGILQDKDWGLMCEVLAPVSDRIICVPVKSERSADPGQLAAACRAANQRADAAVLSSVQEALEALESEPSVVVAGSLYLVGEALEVLNPQNPVEVAEQGLNEWVLPPKN